MSSPLLNENSPTNGVGSVVLPAGFQNDDARASSSFDKKLLIIILANVFGGRDVDIHFVWVPAQSLRVEEDIVVHFVWTVPVQVLLEAVYLRELMEANRLLGSMEEMLNNLRELLERAEELKKQLEELKLRLRAIERRREQNRLKNTIFFMMFVVILMLVLLVKKFLSLF